MKTSWLGSLYKRAFLIGISLAFLLSGILRAAPASEQIASVTSAMAPDKGRIVVDVQGLPPAIPPLFSASADQTIRFEPEEITGETRLNVHVIQGKVERFTFELSPEGEVVGVSGIGLQDWSVRQGVGSQGARRFLDLRARHEAKQPESKEFIWTVLTRVRTPLDSRSATIPLINAGDAIGFHAQLQLVSAPSLKFRVKSSHGLVGDADKNDPAQSTHFVASGYSQLEVTLFQPGASVNNAELINPNLTGMLSLNEVNADFRLKGQLQASKIGVRVRVLSGKAALVDHSSGDGWHVELASIEKDNISYDLVADRVGLLTVDIAFAAQVVSNGDWRTFEFAVPAGSAVPIRLDGLPHETLFKADSPVVPSADGSGWRGYLPSDGTAAVAWKQSHSSIEGALFFTTDELTDVTVEAGALRQSSNIAIRILQGKLSHLQFKLMGAGEILGVAGTNIIDWKVGKNGNERVLNVEFSRPIDSSGTVTVRSQTELNPHQTNADPLRIQPKGTVRHSGFVRISNRGAVRAEITDANGLLQLTPDQFPGPTLEGDPAQVLVYRFPSGLYRYHVTAKRIQAEVAVSFVATYALADTNRGVDFDIELDVREAALREWSFQIPDEYSVTNLSGSAVVDYSVESESALGYRNLRVIFNEDVQGRQLLKLRLEKSQLAAAGDWSLRPLRFPTAKNVHGNVAVSLAAGFRIASADVSQLSEIPLSYFPKQLPGLQQAWRLRSPDWAANLHLEALAQSVQADVFHLYTIKEGVVEGSVLLNYFVVGAPVNDWKIQVPATIGNIDVVGENMRRDWRREGDHLVVALQRPALGAFTLLVTFEQPVGVQGGAIKPAEVRPLNVQSERGYIEIVSGLQVKKDIPVAAGGGLLPLDELELPSEFRLLSNASALASYQYSSRPFSLEFNFQWHQAAETAAQVVDYAKLSSVISRDGQIVTDGQYYVKTRGAKLLRLQLPVEAKLWETRVDNALVAVRLDGDHLIIPLPGRADPNVPSHIQIRFGQVNEGSGTHIKLTAPRASSPVVMSEWILHGDVGRQLISRGGNEASLQAEVAPTGFEWISQHGEIGVSAVLLLIAGGIFFLRNPAGWALLLGFMFYAGAMAELAALLASVQVNPGASLHELSFSSTLLANTQSFVVEATNASATRLDIVWPGAMVAMAGFALVAVAVSFRKNWPSSAAVVFGFGLLLLAIGLLVQRGGAFWFLGAMAIGVLIHLSIAGLAAWQRQVEAPLPVPDLPGGRALLFLVAGAGVLTIGPKPSARAHVSSVVQPWIQEGVKPAEGILQKWEIRGERVYADATITVRGSPGDSFLLLRPPGMLTEFTGEGLRVAKQVNAGETLYYITPERDGVFTGHFRFEMPLPDRSQDVRLPTGTAAIERVNLSLDQGGWEFASPTAIQISPEKANGDQSGAQIVFAPQSVSLIQLRPKQRDVGGEQVKLFAESANLYEPGQGVVNGRTRFAVRPVQGKVSELLVDIPAGLTVADVTNGPVGLWRFDPEKNQLRVGVEPAQTQAFTLDVETQASASALPFELTLKPLRVSGAAGGGGTLALAFGGETQPEAIHPDALSEITVFDFDATLLPANSEKAGPLTIQKVWRYGPEGGEVKLRVAAVEPEVRVFAKQILSFDDDRLLMSVDLNVAITRAGLFQLSFPLPEGLEVEGLTGSNLSQWTETTEQSQRIITLLFTGKTTGEQTFALTLTGPAPRTQTAWRVPSISIREATRQTGVDLVVSGKGLRVNTVAREKATQLDPHELGEMQPGALAFKLLQADATVQLSIEALDPWITVQSLDEVTLREGQTLTHLNLRYRVENAGVKTMRVRLPRMSEEGVRTVHVFGAAVNNIVKRPASADEWEISFQHAIVGDTDVQIEYQQTNGHENNQELILVPVFTGARQVAQYVAVRGSGRIELEAKDLPRGWSHLDWSAVPVFLQNRNDRSEPALTFRAAQPEVALAVNVRRHGLADEMKLQVTEANLTTLISTQQGSLTTVDLKMNVLEKTLFQVRLPTNHQLFNLAVNGSSVEAVREGDTYSLYVAANSASDPTARVRIVYSVDNGARRFALTGPALMIPMENVTWRVIIPEGYRMTRQEGEFVLRGTQKARSFGLEEYQTLTASTRSVDAEKGIAFLDAANKWLQKGDQQKAGELFSRAAASSGLDEASNEDARVQLRKLKTEQAELGLNTRRQRLYLDNRWGVGIHNEQLELAATMNPFMRGVMNFDPQQFDQIMAGNTLDENEALKSIAARLVDQQLSNQIPPNQLDVSLPERGTIATFTQSLRVEGNAPLSIDLQLQPIGRVSGWSIFGPLLGIATIAGFGFVPRRKKNIAA